MKSSEAYPRFALARLETALADTPVVLIHGPRQCGKSTFAQAAAMRHGHTYITFDDENALRAAKEDPVRFCAELPAKAVLDEVQRAPELFISIKASIDRERKPGRIILTGSANVLLLPKLADSLAGRMEILRLGPLAQAEIERRQPEPGFLDRLFKGNFRVATGARLGDELIDRVVAGGFPAALTRSTPRRRREWQMQYIEMITQRDVRELTKIRSIEVVPKLLELAAGQTARLFNASELSGPFELSRPTVREYLVLLDRLFLIEIVRPWHSNRLSRLIKTPKLHLADSGLAAALAGVDATSLKQDRDLLGQFVETFTYQELRRQTTWDEANYRFYHYRDKDQMEVDVVIERDGRAICGIEVKAASTIKPSDFSGIRRLRDASGSRFKCGIVLYDGETTVPFGDQLYAVPFFELWK